MKITDLKQDGHNYRKHGDRNKKMIKKSIDECGYGRSIVVDADGVLIAGNGVAGVSSKETKIKVVETDGSELVVVKRTDLHEGDVRRKKLAMADNATADNVEWDEQELSVDWNEQELKEWGIETGGGKLDKDGNFESMYDAPLQLLPKKEYILVICEQDEFDEAREYFGLGFVAQTNAGKKNERPVKSRTIKFRDYVNSHTKQEQTVQK